MKVLLVGNVNNEPFRLAHELTRRGHDASVILTSESSLDDPRELLEMDYYRDSSVSVVSDVAGLTPWDWMRCQRAIRRHVLERSSRSDVVVCNSVGLSIGPFLNAPVVAFVSGSDLTVYATDAFARSYGVRGRRSRLQSAFTGRSPQGVVRDFVGRQQRGIAGAAFLVAMPEGASRSTDEALKAIGAFSAPRYSWHVSTVTNRDPHSQIRLTYGRNLRVVVGCRLTQKTDDIWTSSDLDDKGTESILRGWKMALSSGFSGSLTLFRKGNGVQMAESLARSLGIDASVRWLQDQRLAAFLHEISKSDVVVDSIGESPPGRVTIEGLAALKPVIARISEHQQKLRLGGVFPQLRSAHDPESFAQALLSIQRQEIPPRTASQWSHLVKEHLLPDNSVREIVGAIEDLD